MRGEEGAEMVVATGRGPGVEGSRLDDDFGTALEAERNRRCALSQPSTSFRAEVADGACDTSVDGRARLLRRVMRGLGREGAAPEDRGLL